MREWLGRQRASVWKIVGGVSLRVKITGMILVMLGLLGVVLAWQVRATMARVLTSESERRGLFAAEDLARRSGDLIESGSVGELQELALATVTSNEDVRYAFIIDAQGQLLAHSFGDRFPPELLGLHAIQGDARYHLETITFQGELIQDVAVSIQEGRAGAARVGISQLYLGRILAEVTRQALATTVLASVLAMVVGAALTWFFTRPVLALTDAIRRVADGDLAWRLVPWSADEIGRAQSSFNEMAERLARSRREMKDSNKRLQRRNRELSALNIVSRAVTGPLGLTEAMERALQQAMGLVDTTGGWICLLAEGDFCQVCVQAGETLPGRIGLGSGQICTPCLDATRTRQPLVMTPHLSECSLHDIQCPVRHVVVPLLAKERAVGLLNLVCPPERDFAADELNLLANLGRQLGVVIENARLWEELRRKEAVRGQLLRKIITAQEEERLRIARELHDEAGQALTSILVGLRVIDRAQSMDTVHTLASDLKAVVTQTLDEVHALAMELRPSVLDDLGLVPALERYVQSCPSRFGFQADFVATGIRSRRLPSEVETTLYRIAQEALTNVARHADASHASVLLQQREGVVVLVVEDDGVGFDVDQMASSPEERQRLGLFGIKERASLVEGRVRIESEPNAGTTVSVEIPLEGTWLLREGTVSPEQSHPSVS